MPTDFDVQAPPVGEAYSDPDGLTFKVVRFEQAAIHGLPPALSILLSTQDSKVSSSAEHRHVSVADWPQFVMQHCLMRLHLVSDSAAADLRPAMKSMSAKPGRRPWAQRIRLALDTAACYLAGQFIALRDRSA